MTGHVTTFFRTRLFGADRLRLEPGSIMAPSHRSDNDVPVLASLMIPFWTRTVAQGGQWPTFATLDEAFVRGFLAGYPPGLPIWLRRLLWPIRVGGVLERRLQCVPVREPWEMLLVELLRTAPEQPLDGQLPPGLKAALEQRAAKLGRARPLRAADVLSGAYADLLWTPVERDDVAADPEVWRSHTRAAIQDFRRLSTTLRARGMVVIFPEGELSPDGRIGPLKSGLASLARRGHASLVQPVAISYDPLTFGRTRAYVSIAEAIEPVPKRVSDVVTDAMRRATTLSPGQIAAWTLLEGGGTPRALAAAADQLINRAIAQGRPIEPGLRGSRRASLLRVAHAQARQRGPRDPVIARLATELRSIDPP